MMWMSVPQIPQASTLTTIWPSPGVGSGTSATRKLPGRSSTMARMRPPWLTRKLLTRMRGLAREAGAGDRVEREDVVRLDQEGDPLPGRRGLAPLGPGHHAPAAGHGGVAGQPDMQQRVGSQLFDEQHLAGEHHAGRRGARGHRAAGTGSRPAPRVLGQVQVLGPDADDELGELVPRRRGPDPRGKGNDRAGQGRAALGQRRGQQVHRRGADEAGHELVHRVVVQLTRRGTLLEVAAAEHRHPVPHGHGFYLVMRHVDRGDAEAALQLGDLAAGLHAQLGVEVGQRLVHQEDLGLPHDGPAHGDALPLGAGQLLRLPAEHALVEIEDARRLADPAVAFVLVDVLHLQGEAPVLRDGLARVQRVVLEHHRNVPVRHGDVLGLTWSRTLSGLAAALTQLPPCPIVQTTGAVPPPDGRDLLEVVRSVARIGGGPAHVFYAPMLLDDARAAAAIRRQGDIAEAFAIVPKVTIAVVAIGAWGPGLSTIYDAITPAEREALAALGVGAEIAGVFIGAGGTPLTTPLDNRMIVTPGS